MSWPGITMFLLFFGIATMDALTSRNWIRIVFWVAMAIAFAVLDWVGQRRRVSLPRPPARARLRLRRTAAPSDPRSRG